MTTAPNTGFSSLYETLSRRDRNRGLSPQLDPVAVSRFLDHERTRTNDQEESRFSDLLGTVDTGRSRALAALSGGGAASKREIDIDTARNKGSISQNFISRGLSGGSAELAAKRRQDEVAQRGKSLVDERYAFARAGVESDFTSQKAGAINSKTVIGPDAGTLTSLVGQQSQARREEVLAREREDREREEREKRDRKQSTVRLFSPDGRSFQDVRI